MKVVAFSGGVGGARLVDGLAAQLRADELTVVVNTGDDFRHCGLWVCPDLDTVMYTLSGRAPVARGWGLAEETYTAMDGLKTLGGPDWFALSDQDLATHLLRSQRLDEGHSLRQITHELMTAHAITTTVLPMCNAPHPTQLHTSAGLLDFQDWFVARRAEPSVQRVVFPKAGAALPAAVKAVEDADLIIMTPSNPYLSIDPILSLAALNQALAKRRCLCIGVSPIVGGRAIKGPLATLIPALAGRPASAAAVADHYGDYVDGWVVETGDETGISKPSMGTATIMHDRQSRKQLAGAVLGWAQTLGSRP